MQLIVTAGPTREYLDDVRFISNASSGRMGYAIARAAAKAGHKVTLISGPVALKPPASVKTISVTSTKEMYEAATKHFPKADGIIGAAAPADYTPARRSKGKRKKSADALALRLKPTIDILARLGKRKGKRIIIAFALEVQQPLKNALRKMSQKNADAIILNPPAAIAAPRSNATILTPTHKPLHLHNTTKNRLARKIIILAEELHGSE